MPFIVGESIGPYRLVEQLGQGGMATVFKAYHARLDRYVAIKALHPAFTTEANFLARFEREAQVVARLEHAHIVPVYDYSEHEGRPYLVMKYIEGETLKARLHHGPLTPDELTRIVGSVGAALAYAHQQGVLHRDIKPSNVLLTPQGQVYLADFGLARMASAGESTLSSDVMLGTPQYISPEQARGDHNLDGGTDIYSFGVLLYELVVGKVPYSADTPYSVIHDHIYAPLPLPRTINPDIPEAVERVLLKALSKDRRDRYEDVAALVTAWHAALPPGGLLPNTPASTAVATAPTAIAAATAAATGDDPLRTRLLPDEQPTTVSPQTPTTAASPALSAAATDVPAVAGTPAAEPPAATPAPRSRRWIWFAGAGLLVVCLCIPALMIANGLRPNNNARMATRTSQMMAAAPLPATEAPQMAAPGEPVEAPPPLNQPGLPPGDNPPAEAPPGPGGQRTPLRPALRDPEILLPANLTPPVPLATAQAAVTAQPNPEHYLDLALAYWAEGQPEAARQALAQGVRMSDTSEGFYLRAGDSLAERGLWLLAASLYVDAIRNMPDPLPVDVRERVSQALYLAAAAPEAAEIVRRMPSNRLGKDFTDLVSARHAIYQNEMAVAEPLIRRLNERIPGTTELALLNADLAIHNGQMEEARAALIKLAADGRAPAWVQRSAAVILQYITP